MNYNTQAKLRAEVQKWPSVTSVECCGHWWPSRHGDGSRCMVKAASDSVLTLTRTGRLPGLLLGLGTPGLACRLRT